MSSAVAGRFAVASLAVAILAACPALLKANPIDILPFTVNGFGGTFGAVEQGTTQAVFVLKDGEVSVSYPDDIESFAELKVNISDLTVDVGSWNESDPSIRVTTDGSPVMLITAKMVFPGNPVDVVIDVGEIMFDVIDPTLTQFLTDPIGGGFIQSELAVSGPQTSTGIFSAEGLYVSPLDQTLQVNIGGIEDMLLSYIGVAVTPGLADVGFVATASVTAVPEPSAFLLGLFAMLGLGVHGIRCRSRKAA